MRLFKGNRPGGRSCRLDLNLFGTREFLMRVPSPTTKTTIQRTLQMHGRTSVKTLKAFLYHCQIELVVLIFLSFLFFYWALNANAFERHNPFGEIQTGNEFTSAARESECIEFKLDLNNASKAELTLLPRIGATIAGRIVDYRSNNGRFENVDELLNIKGVGPKTLARIRPYCQTTASTQETLGSNLNDTIPQVQ